MSLLTVQVFLSYNREDSEAVEEVARRLRRDGIEPWFDRWSAAPGQAWQVQIAEALGAVSACAVFVGPHGLGGWARQELAVAQDRVSRDRGFRLFMVLLPGATDPQDPALAFLSQRTWVDLRQGIRTADGHRELLRAITGLGTMPSPEVSALHERLLQGKAIDEPAPAPRRDQEGARGSPQRGQDIGLPHFGGARATQAFVGRRDELTRLHALWPTGSEGEPMLLVLQGEPGVGKSWLASRFAAETHREGAFVLYGRCEAEAIVPYEPFVEALRHGLQEMPPAADSGLAVELAALGALIPEARMLAGESSQPPDRDPERERYHLCEAVTRLLGHWAADRPVLLVIDDLQWADKPTLLMLRHVARRQEHHLVAILATLRSDEAQSPALAKILNDLGREPGVNRVTMEGLAEPDAAELAASRLEAPQPAAFPLPVVAPRTSEGVFVGREECLARLRSPWQDSRLARTNLVLLVGEAGVGKTRLATRFAEEVHRDGGVALYGRADKEALLPYQPFAEALNHLIAHAGTAFTAEELEILVRLFPSLGVRERPAPEAGDKDALRHRVFEAVVSVLSRASSQWPLLLVLDDLHWADKPTLGLLRHVLRHASRARLLVVGTLRPLDPASDHPLVDFLTDLRRELRYDRLSLKGLDEQETHALVMDRLGVEVTPRFLHRLQEQTDGNAFFIEETVRALLDDSGISQDAVVDEDALQTLGVPEGVAEVIIRHARQLSPLASELLTAASVVGPSFRFGLVKQLVDANPDEVIDAIEESMVAGLVLEVPDRVGVFTFSHALVREVLRKQLSATRRVHVHHRVAQALELLCEREPVNPAELAYHFAQARQLAGSGPARRYAIAAGRRAADVFAYDEAAEHFRRALELFEDADEEAGRCEVLLALGRVEWHAGDDRARQTFSDAADSAERRGDADQLARAALGLGERYFEVTYLGARYRELLEKAIAAVGPPDSRRRALLLSRLAVTLGFPNEDERAQELATKAVAMARRLQDEKLLAAVLLARHVTLLDVCSLDERLALSDELSMLAGGHHELAAERHQWRMYDLLGVGDLDAAWREQAELEALAAKLGQPLLRSLAVGARGLRAELEGDAELAERCADESLHQARLAHTKDALSSWASQLFALRRRQGRLAELAPDVVHLAGSGGHQLGWLSALGVLRFETGNVHAAREIYETEMSAGPAGLPRGMFWLTRVALLSELCAKLNDEARAAALYAELAPHAGRNVVVAYCSFWGPVDGYLALLAETSGKSALAAEHVRAGLARTRAMNAPLLTRDLEERTRP